jgi:hypothetical protein
MAAHIMTLKRGDETLDQFGETEARHGASEEAYVPNLWPPRSMDSKGDRSTGSRL